MLHILICLYTSHLLNREQKRHICETRHGIKTDKMDALVANVCIMYYDLLWRMTNKFVSCTWSGLEGEKKLVRWLGFAVLTAIAGTAASRDMRVREKSQLSACIWGKSLTNSELTILIHVAWSRLQIRSGTAYQRESNY